MTKWGLTKIGGKIHRIEGNTTLCGECEKFILVPLEMVHPDGICKRCEELDGKRISQMMSGEDKPERQKILSQCSAIEALLNNIEKQIGLVPPPEESADPEAKPVKKSLQALLVEAQIRMTDIQGRLHSIISTLEECHGAM